MSHRQYLFALAVLVLGTANAHSATLIVRVVGMKEVVGNMHYGIYDSAEKFPKEGTQTYEGWVEVKGPEAVIRIPNIPKGRYGVAVYHDKNANQVFDTNFLGLPEEDYGFSNDAPVFLGPPSFEDAAVAVPDEAAETVVDITINLR